VDVVITVHQEALPSPCGKESARISKDILQSVDIDKSLSANHDPIRERGDGLVDYGRWT